MRGKHFIPRMNRLGRIGSGFAGSLAHDAHLAVRNVLRDPRRSALAIAAAAFGVVALVIAGSFIQWMLWAMREGTIETSIGHLQVVRKGYFEHGLADPLHYLITGADPDARALSAIAHVKAVAPRLSFNGFVSHGDATISFIGEGVDPASEARFRNSVVIKSGRQLDAGDDDGVILGRGLADNLGVAIGDRVVLLVNAASGGVNAVEVPVRGIFSTVSKAYDDSALRVPLRTAQKLMRISGVHRLVVLLDDTENTDEALTAVRATIDGKRLEAVAWPSLADFYRKSAALLSRQMSVMRVIVAAIVVMSILNTMTMNVLERIAEIGTLLAMGTPAGRVLRRFIFEGTLIGLVGSLLGVAIGLVLAYAISSIGIPMPPPPGMSEAYTAKLLVTPMLVLSSVALVAGVTALASLYPAHKAARLNIVDALRTGR